MERSDGLARVDFEDMPVGQPPRGFTSARTGSGDPGAWTVGEEPGAGKLLAQTSTDDTSHRFPLCVLAGFEARDVTVSARFRARAGEVDRAAGLVVRYRGPDEYYVVRANALENNVRLYRVVGGKREQFAGTERSVSADEWHTLRLDASGPRFAVFLDGALLFLAADAAIADGGQIGLWTKADSVTWFDDLRYGPVPADSPSAALLDGGR
jgi:hypothetical protein